MKRSLFSIILMIAATPLFAQPTGLITVPVPEPSTISLLMAGIIALSIARRRIEK